MAVVVANYVPVGSSGWAWRLSRAMTYYAHRPGDDLHDERDETPAAERRFRRTYRDDPHVVGRFFHTSDGQQLPLAEAEDRLFARVEARRAEYQQQREAARMERKTARDAAFDERCRRFVDGEDRRPGRRELSRERREQLVGRWRQTRAAQERLPDPVFRVYRVILSTERALMDGRDLREVLEIAVTGAVGAAVGAVRHAAGTAYRNAQRARARGARAQPRGQPRAPEWMYVRHDTGSHPHVHALLLTEGRGLSTRDLDRMRDALAEREAVREREQTTGRQRTDEGRD